jgi:hypothetical protein
MKKVNQAQKWATMKILKSTKNEIQHYCNTKGIFANPSQFITFAIRKELDRRTK